MKEYNVKYNVDDEVYVLLSKSIIKNRIDGIRITENRPYIDGNNNMKPMDGIVIEYLIATKRDDRGFVTYLDWFVQEDVYSDREELIRQIK